MELGGLTARGLSNQGLLRPEPALPPGGRPLRRQPALLPGGLGRRVPGLRRRLNPPRRPHLLRRLLLPLPLTGPSLRLHRSLVQRLAMLAVSSSWPSR